MEDGATGSTEGKTLLFEAFALVGKALASPKRLEIIDVLAQGERSVEVLATAVGVGMTTASNNLQVLKQSGLVATRKVGIKVFYRLAGPDIAALWAKLRDVASDHLGDVDRARTAYLGPEDTEQVTRDELLARIEKGGVTVIDVRPPEEYASGHIPGAVSVPLDELAERLTDLPADGTVVAYCRGSYCVMAHDAVRTLLAHGRSAVRLADGMLEWSLADLPVAR